jgi:GNAT superfamily N-acetyltransferase
MMAGHETWVAVLTSGKPAGYAVAGPLGGYFHLRELSVDPPLGRRRIGTALVETVIAAAREKDFSGVTLTTFRDVPFNAPFYARLGFEELPLQQAGEALRAAFFREVPAGVDPARRVLMWLRS